MSEYSELRKVNLAIDITLSKASNLHLPIKKPERIANSAKCRRLTEVIAFIQSV